jgi:subtilisin family serine protease
VSTRPAFSAAFEPERLQTLEALLPVEDITPEWAWGGATGKGVKVAVVDSGVDADHPVIDGRVAGYMAVSVAGLDEVVFDDSPHEDTSGHGTACAGIILGLAPECELYSVQVMGRKGGKGVALVAGIRWAVEHGMQVANLSLGTTRREFFATLHELTDEAYFRHVVLVTAANNFPIPSFPCEYASVISVASHDTSDPFLFYYNPEPPTEFGAFGIDVPAPWKGGGVSKVTGNSFAAPHITGIVARILEKHPSLTVFQAKGILRALSANVRRGPEPSAPGA